MVAGRSHDALRRQASVEGVTVDVRGSIGVASSPTHGQDPRPCSNAPTSPCTRPNAERQRRVYERPRRTNTRRRCVSLVELRDALQRRRDRGPLPAQSPVGRRARSSASRPSPGGRTPTRLHAARRVHPCRRAERSDPELTVYVLDRALPSPRLGRRRGTRSLGGGQPLGRRLVDLDCRPRPRGCWRSMGSRPDQLTSRSPSRP